MHVSSSFKLDCCQKIGSCWNKIEKDFDGTNFLWEVTSIKPETRKYTAYYNEDEIEEELLHYYIGKFLHKDEMKKYKVGTKILKNFQGTWHHGKIE